MIAAYLDCWIDYCERYTSHHRDRYRFCHVRLVEVADLRIDLGNPNVHVCGVHSPLSVPAPTREALALSDNAPSLELLPGATRTERAQAARASGSVDLLIDGWISAYSNDIGCTGHKFCGVLYAQQSNQVSSLLSATPTVDPTSWASVPRRYRAPSGKPALRRHEMIKTPLAPRAKQSAVSSR